VRKRVSRATRKRHLHDLGLLEQLLEVRQLGLRARLVRAQHQHAHPDGLVDQQAPEQRLRLAAHVHRGDGHHLGELGRGAIDVGVAVQARRPRLGWRGAGLLGLIEEVRHEWLNGYSADRAGSELAVLAVVVLVP
jgi:hypothetical protein